MKHYQIEHKGAARALFMLADLLDAKDVFQYNSREDLADYVRREAKRHASYVPKDSRDNG